MDNKEATVTSNQLAVANSQTSLTTFTPKLQDVISKVSTTTAEIIQAVHGSRSFAKMSEIELQDDAELIVADIKTVTGLKLPTGNGFIRLKQLVGESLSEDYPFYTLSLLLKAVKKYGSVLTFGENKSYGREISLADVHQIMNAYKAELDQANHEIDTVLRIGYNEEILTEEQKDNIVRLSIQQRYEAGDFDSCTYPDYNQLLKDDLIQPDFINRFGWKAIQKLKHRWIHQIETIPANTDPQSLKGVAERNELQDKLKLVSLIEDEIKGLTASAYLNWAKVNNNPFVYQISKQ